MGDVTSSALKATWAFDGLGGHRSRVGVVTALPEDALLRRAIFHVWDARRIWCSWEPCVAQAANSGPLPKCGREDARTQAFCRAAEAGCCVVLWVFRADWMGRTTRAIHSA